MAFEALKAEIYLLLEEMQNAPEDRHELHQQVVQKLTELRAFGMLTCPRVFGPIDS